MTYPKSIGELRRLAADEEDWKLRGAQPAASRTRGGASAGHALEPMEVEEVEESEEAEEDTDEEEAVEVTPPKPPKPPNHRVLLEVLQVEKVIEQLGCPECGEPIALTFRTVCIATSIGLECSNEDCTYFFHPEAPAETNIHDAKDGRYERTTDYAINVLYVLGFLSMGDGPTEAARMLGLLGLPNDTTMQSRSFGIIEERIAPIITELCRDIIQENLAAEVKMAMEESATQDHLDFALWQASLKDPTIELPESKRPKLDFSYDMAWQQKGSGHQYNSASGHGTFMGSRTRKVCGLVIKSKVCNQCNLWKRKFPGIQMPEWHHDCWKNHDGTSGSMESAACLEMVVSLYREKNCIVARLCCDDDSSIRADCQWNNATYLKNYNVTKVPLVPKKSGINKGELQPRPDKGILPGEIPEPLFVADPNHRCKGLTGELIALDLGAKSKNFTLSRMDSTRIGKNFGYMARTLKLKPESEYEKAGLAVLEHHFDNHEHCGEWCRRHLQTEEQRKISKKYYRCKKGDAKLYALLQTVIARFITKDRLLDMAHGLDTNMNEAFNQIATWYAPKNKVYAGAYSLNNRIAFAVGINSLGVVEYFKRLFRRLGITLTPNVEHFLTLKETKRAKKLAKSKTPAAKKRKNEVKYNKLAEATKEAKRKRHKNQGVYRRGMNLDETYEEALALKPPKKASKGFCEWCGSSNHLTQKSGKCTRKDLTDAKMYRRIDGSLLSGPPNVPPRRIR